MMGNAMHSKPGASKKNNGIPTLFAVPVPCRWGDDPWVGDALQNHRAEKESCGDWGSKSLPILEMQKI